MSLIGSVEKAISGGDQGDPTSQGLPSNLTEKTGILTDSTLPLRDASDE